MRLLRLIVSDWVLIEMTLCFFAAGTCMVLIFAALSVGAADTAGGLFLAELLITARAIVLFPRAGKSR